MKELLEKLETISIEDSIGRGYTLLDTCFFIHNFEHPDKAKLFKEKLKQGKFAITSFNIEELIHLEHHLKPRVKEEIRKFLKDKEDIVIIKVNVSPGNKAKEKEYVISVEPEILNVVKDPSDCVLYAVAIQTLSDIITRDKHHIYNQLAESFANKHQINIKNKI